MSKVGRRRKGAFDDLMEIGSKLPWKVAAVAAVVSFLALHALAGIDVGTATNTKDIGTVAAKQIFRMVGLIGQIVVPIGLLIGACVGFLKQRNAATIGDLSPPASRTGCPVCGGPMVRRQAKRGANAGNHFFGCSRYPACKGTRVG